VVAFSTQSTIANGAGKPLFFLRILFLKLEKKLFSRFAVLISF